VVSAAFAGRRTLERHRLVHAALGARLGTEVHALSLRTFAPDELGR
jgi:stress-induced morphogen